jgi:tetratricopeptide (TPR) repeat protein
MPHEHIDPDVLRDALDEHDIFGRWIAVAIVATTLLGAFVAFRQADSAYDHAEAASEAEQWATLATGARNRSEKAARLQVSRARLALADRVRAQHATAARRLGVGGDPLALRLEAQRWGQLAARVAVNSQEIADDMATEFRRIETESVEAFPNADPREGEAAECEHPVPTADRAPNALETGLDPDADSAAVERYLAQAGREAYRFDALRDGATHEAEGAEKQFTRYAVSLAMFAVAVFLLGYALTPFGHRHRRLYAFVAGSIALGSAGWAVYAAVKGPERPSQMAAAAYADGRVALASREERQAVSLLTCALEYREEFPAAYLARSEAFQQLGTAQPGQAIYNETLVDATFAERAAEDAERAGTDENEDEDEASVVATRATGVYVKALRDHDDEGFEEALALHREARELQPNFALHSFNVGTTLLALGRPWRAAYDEALRLAPQVALADYVPAAMTDLEVTAAEFPRTADEAVEAKEQVVSAALLSGSAEVGQIPAVERGTVSDVYLRVSPAIVEVGFTTERPLRKLDVVYAAIYRETDGNWAVLPTLSGPMTALQSSGRRSYLQVIAPTSGARCDADGHYKVEVYVNGRLPRGGTAEAEASFPDLEHVVLEDLNVELCRPSGWDPAEGRVRGVVDGFTSPDGSSGVLVVDASAAVSAGVRRAALVERVLDRFVEIFPRNTEFSSRMLNFYSLGLAGQPVEIYSYPDGLALFGNATTSADRAVVTAVYGPGSSFPEASSESKLSNLDVFWSMLSRDP